MCNLHLCILNANIVICFGFKKTNREISTTGGEIMYLFFEEFCFNTYYILSIFFQRFILKLNFGQRPRQCLNKSYLNRISKNWYFKTLFFYFN